MLRTNLWTITMQNVSGIKKWNYEKLPLNFAMQFPFPFPVIPGNNNVSFPFPKCGNGISIPVPKNWEWNFPVPVPKSWEWNFLFPFPFPKFGNGLSHSRSRSQMTKSHSRSPLPQQRFKHFKGEIFRPEQTPPTESTRPNNNRGRQKEPHNRYVRWLHDNNEPRN